MSSQIHVRSTRSKSSKSNAKFTSQGLHSPVSNAPSARLSAPKSLSPVRVAKYPRRGVNIPGKGTSLISHTSANFNTSSNDSNVEDANDSMHDFSAVRHDESFDETSEEHTQTTHGSGDGAGDNTDSTVVEGAGGSNSPLIPEDLVTGYTDDPAKNILLVLSELRDIKKGMVKMAKLDTIEVSTATLAEQLGGAIKRTAEVESAVAANTIKIRKLDDGLATITSKVGKQDKALAGFNSMREEIAKSSAETIAEMNGLIDTQRQQVDSFNSGSKQLKRDILAEVDKKLKKNDKDRHCQSLKNQAFENRYNLILIGLAEDSTKPTIAIAKKFFAESLDLHNLELKSALRLGAQPGTGGAYARPVIVKFKQLAHRNSVWRKRGVTLVEGEENKVRIQADLPKELREGVQALYKVARAGAHLEGYESARVHNYQLEVNDQIYQISDLEDLPHQIRPSTLASPKSETHMVFYSRHAKMSNHFPSKFTINAFSFNSMEQFLAVRKAELSGKEDWIRKAKQAQDPVQAKQVLNALKDDHPLEWEQGIEETTMEGLRAKFGQNRSLYNYICSTKHLILGEASKNARWGIGMEPSDPEVLNHSRWLETGNLLGRSLMRVREEFLSKGKKPANKQTR